MDKSVAGHSLRGVDFCQAGFERYWKVICECGKSWIRTISHRDMAVHDTHGSHIELLLKEQKQQGKKR